MRNLFIGMLPLLVCLTCLSAEVDSPNSKGSFNCDGVPIAYSVFGEGSPVVTVHGLTGNQKHMRRLRKALLDAGFQVITFDVRGHGESGKPHEEAAYGAAKAGDIARLLNHLSIGRAHVVGYSMGGDIANKFRELHPHRAQSIVMGGVGLGVTEGWTKDPFDFADLAKSLQNGEGFKPLLQQPGAIHPGIATKDEIARVNGMMTRGQDELALAAIVQAYADLEVDRNELENSSVPTLIIVGEEDAEKPSASKLHELMRGSELHIIDGVNHFEAAATQDFVDSVVRFVSAHDSKVQSDEEESSVMQGSPPSKDALVTWENFEQSQSKFRWAVQHFREFFPTQAVTRRDAPVNPLKASSRKLPRKLQSCERLDDMLDRLDVDAFIVLHEGEIVEERYFHGMRPETQHFLLSIHKSIVATVIGSLTSHGISLEKTIETYVRELRGTAHEGATVRQVLDMLSSVEYSYVSTGKERPTFERHKDSVHPSAQYRMNIPNGSQEFLLSLPGLDHSHGEKMRYKESDPAILVWAAEKVAKRRFADVVQERLWSKIGAEYELEAVCDSHGFWTHYVSCTARDLARWGQMLADRGRVGDEKVVPKAFIEDIRQFDKPDLLRNDHLVGPFMPEGISYRSFFYVDSLGEDAIAAMGGYGQLCYISPATKTVIVILSSQAPFAARFADGESPEEVLQIGRAEEKERWELCREICRTLARN